MGVATLSLTHLDRNSLLIKYSLVVPPTLSPHLVIIWFVIHRCVQVCITLLAPVLREDGKELPDISLPATEPGPVSFSKT